MCRWRLSLALKGSLRDSLVSSPSGNRFRHQDRTILPADTGQQFQRPHPIGSVKGDKPNAGQIDQCAKTKVEEDQPKASRFPKETERKGETDKREHPQQ